MDRNFYFRGIADAVVGSANFASLISSGFATYGLTNAQATAFATLNSALQSAYTLAAEPSTRTSVTIAARNVAMENMRNNAKFLAKIIYANSAVNDAQLEALGLLPRANYSPIQPLTVAPGLEVVSNVGRMVKIRLKNTQAADSRGKPKGCVGANIYTYVGATPPTDPTQYFFQGMTTRTIADIQLSNSTPSGATVWICACWVSSRGYLSPASTPFSFNIQGGVISSQAA